MGDIFISYAHRDRKKVARLVDRLKERKLNVWWDALLPVGEEWDDEVEAALRKSSIVVIVWSEASVKSREVRDEAYFARDLDKTIVPVRIEEVSPPYRFLRNQRFDVFGNPIEDDPSLEALIDAIRNRRAANDDEEPAEREEAAPDKTAKPIARRRGAMLVSALLLISGMAIVGGGYAFLDSGKLIAAIGGAMLMGASLMYALQSFTSRGR